MAMTQAQHRLMVATPGAGLHEITGAVEGWLSAQAVRRGLLTLFLRHTSASLLIQENADPDVRHDLQVFFGKLVAEDSRLYVHTAEGPDDMPAHIRSALMPTHLAIPVDDGRLLLGTWQGIYLFEHRRAPHRREIILHLTGE
jgi:secondary thiamine-phosphate synthase enzyme